MNDLYINKCKAFIGFLLNQQQWSGLTMMDVDSWLSNFKDLNCDEKELIYKLLTNIIYFSENDVIDALRMGVYNCLSYSIVLKKQIESDFSLSMHALMKIHRSNVQKSCFVPLLDSAAPHESANSVCRILVQQGIVPTGNSVFIDQVPILLKNKKIDNLIIVDDCVGSGDQLRAFWKDTKVHDDGKEIRIGEMCQKYGVAPNYLTLFGYERSIDDLCKEFPELRIICVRKLNDQHRVFSDCSYIWKDKDEKKKAFELIDSLAKAAGVPTYGYKGLDFAFIMHKTIPDWSLPIFWKENSDWKLLLRRKNSND